MAVAMLLCGYVALSILPWIGYTVLINYVQAQADCICWTFAFTRSSLLNIFEIRFSSMEIALFCFTGHHSNQSSHANFRKQRYPNRGPTAMGVIRLISRPLAFRCGHPSGDHCMSADPPGVLLLIHMAIFFSVRNTIRRPLRASSVLRQHSSSNFPSNN